ncbi:MAG: transglutaminase domain-containing protein [Ruminococcus sp.]|nr:transglutaminase domain-containing protein [Ruminococcus sp.]
MKNTKKRKRDIGLISPSGIVIDGDILLDCQNEHTSKYFLAVRVFLSFIATYCTAVMGASFLNLDIAYTVLFFYSAMLTVSFGLLRSKHSIVRLGAIVYLVFHAFYIGTNFENIRYGFYVVADDYLSKANQPNSVMGVVLQNLKHTDYSYYATIFFVVLITLLALVTAAACVYKIDFPLLFIITFPIFELGMYWGWVPDLVPTVCLFIVWIIILAMHIINHTTNKAGRRNTFAVHERKKTYYFTSSNAKGAFYTVYVRFIALMCAVIFTAAMLFSLITGFTRPRKFNKYRREISTAVSNFTMYDLQNLFSDYNGGADIFGVKTVGGTNGGILGQTSGISFNGSTALRLTASPFSSSLYLKGYVGGVYKDNSWLPVDADEDDVDFDDDFEDVGLWPQDMNYLIAHECRFASDDIDELTIYAVGASKKFVYAPYSTFYSETSSNQKNGMTPTLEGYVKPGSDKYTITYCSYDRMSGDLASVEEDFRLDFWHNKEEADPALTRDAIEALDGYTEFVEENYTKVHKSKTLDRVYNEIATNYLGGSGNWTYYEVYNAIKSYFAESGEYKYSLQPGITPEGEDFIDYFLDTQKEGYCSYYASAGVELLRKFGYPARYVEGYMILPSQLGNGEDEDGTYKINVKDKCAHAWAEVYIENAGWYPAEFTPGYDNDNPNLSDDEKDPGSKKRNSDSSRATPDSSAAPSDSSSSNAGTVSRSGTESSDSSSKVTSSNTSSKSSAANSGTDPSGKIGSGSGADHAAADESLSGKSESTKPKSMSGAIISVAALLFVVAIVALNRTFKNKAMIKAVSEGSGSERIMAMYRYLLKYLSLVGVYKGGNVSDLRTAELIINNLSEKQLSPIADDVRYIAELAIKAHMSNEEISDKDADMAKAKFDSIRLGHIYPQLSIGEKLSATLVSGLY